MADRLGAGPPPEQMRQSFADVGAFIARLTDAGAFVLAGGLVPAESATVVRQSGADFLIPSCQPWTAITCSTRRAALSPSNPAQD